MASTTIPSGESARASISTPASWASCPTTTAPTGARRGRPVRSPMSGTRHNSLSGERLIHLIEATVHDSFLILFLGQIGCANNTVTGGKQGSAAKGTTAL